MAEYSYAEDGKLHTRFSDLVRCTEGSVLTVAREMLLGRKRFSSDIVEFGRLRHEMWEEEARATGRSPECFREVGVDVAVTDIEQEYSMEIFPGVVLHSRIDAFASEEGLLIDWKTFTNDGDIQKYKNSRQHLVYGLQKLNTGVIVKGAMYVGEQWDKKRQKLLGYDKIVLPFSVMELAEFKNGWLRDRAERLVVAVEMLKKDIDTFS